MRVIKFRVWSLYGGHLTMIGWDKLIWLEALLNILSGDAEASLMQYTGLKDKNGVEIYEGDILNWRYMTDDKELAEANHGTLKVEWAAGGWRVETISGPSPGTALWVLIENAQDEREEYEVIGNVYENPELL